MKRFLVILLFGLFLVGCGSSSPEEVAESFIKAGFKGDGEKMISYIHFPKETQKDGTKDMIGGKIKQAALKGANRAEQKGGVKSIKAKQAEINDTKDRARVAVEIVFKNDEKSLDNVNLIKVDGDWKVHLK